MQHVDFSLAVTPAFTMLLPHPSRFFIRPQLLTR